MYRSYTQNFRIFGAIMNFLQIPKVSALFINSENKNHHCSSSSLALTGGPHPSVTQTCHDGAALTDRPQNALTVTLRRNIPHQYDLLLPQNQSQLSKRKMVPWRHLHAGHGGLGTTVYGVATVMLQ